MRRQMVAGIKLHRWHRAQVLGKMSLMRLHKHLWLASGSSSCCLQPSPTPWHGSTCPRPSGSGTSGELPCCGHGGCQCAPSDSTVDHTCTSNSTVGHTPPPALASLLPVLASSVTSSTGPTLDADHAWLQRCAAAV